ncbi:MAG TPA: magnesium transporter CorA family protein [Anaeromyxobacter sp.]|nr:magnesium transporter CorA family protein [Anaeromyxobacter sp.]
MPRGRARMRVVRLEQGRVVTGGRELVRPGAATWIDARPTPEDIAFIGQKFAFHPLALEDAAHQDQRPKLEQYGPGMLIAVVHRLQPTPDDSELLALELDALLTPEALVTFHESPIAEVDRVFTRCCAEPDVLARGPDFVLYLLHDALTDIHYALVDALTGEIEEIFDEVSAHERAEDAALLARIVSARRAHAMLRRRLSPQREVFAALARPGQTVVKDQNALYFRDVVDHSVRLTDEIDTGRDLLASAMDAYLSHNNNRLAAVTARLTLIATIFLPLNFIAAFFGMNLDILHPRIAIPIVLATVVTLPVTMVWFFKKKRLL